MKKIIDEIKRILEDCREEHSLSDLEIEKLAVIVATVAGSAPYVREIFFSEILNIARVIQDVLEDEKEKIMKKIKDGGNGGILN